MSGREVVLLGTVAALPTRERNHVATLVRLGGRGVLVDCGEGTQRQLVRAGLGSTKVDVLALTHLHGDHCLGVPGLLQRRGVEAPDARPLPLVHPAEQERVVDALLAGSVVATPPAVERVGVAQPAPGAVVDVRRLGPWTLRAAALDHRTETLGYRLDEDDGVTLLPEALAARGVAGPDVGRLIREGRLDVDGRTVTLDEVSEPRRGQSVAVVMDTRDGPGARALAAGPHGDGVDLLVVEATFADGDEDRARRYDHLTARQAGRLAAEAGATRLVLTHFSGRLDDVSRSAEQAGQEHPDVVAAHDLDVVALPGRRR